MLFGMSEFPRQYNAAEDLVDRHLAEGRQDRIAFRDDRGALTYGELARHVNRAGNALLALGIEPEQRVVLLLQDTTDFPAVFLGAIKAGIVPIPVNTLLTAADYEHMLVDSRARALVVSEPLLPKVETAIAHAPLLRHVLVSRPTAQGNAAHGHLDAHLAAASDALTAFPTTPDDVAFWLYSSGSTGAAKGAIHLHAHLMQTAKMYAQGVLGIREDDVVFSAAKLFFAYGLGNALTFPLSVGATAILMAERPTPASVLRTLHEHQPTIFCGVPTLFAAMLADTTNGGMTREAGSRALRVCVSAGEALPKHVGEAWRERMGTDILDGIGTTELLHIFLSNRPGDVRYGTSGKPVPGYEVRLLGDDGQPVPAGEEGSLWVKAPSAAAAYWNQRELSTGTFQGPWTRTGDRYVCDAEGYFTYLGRSDDMLKVGGIWVSPFEVESALAQHEAVLEAAVVGHTDGDRLVKPKAYVVLRQGHAASEVLENALKDFVKSKLAPYKYPRWIEFLPDLPKMATGKIQRFRLRAKRSTVVAGGRRLEVQRHDLGSHDQPVLVFLHEGLGSISLWRDFPEALARRTARDSVVYSRWGYGGSDPVTLPRPLTYMHDEAALLPEVLDACHVEKAILVGHSDGGSIALLHAASEQARDRVVGLILEAPHVFCEDISVRSIAEARRQYEETDLRARLMKHHGDNVDGAFWGWNRAWLDPEFRKWNIEWCLPNVDVPVLVLQGADDEYGTLAQLDAIEHQVKGPVTRRVLAECGHSPHRDQRDAALEAMARFVGGLS